MQHKCYTTRNVQYEYTSICVKIYSCKDLGLQITRVYFGYTNHDRLAFMTTVSTSYHFRWFYLIYWFLLNQRSWGKQPENFEMESKKLCCVFFFWWSYLNFGVCVRAFWCHIFHVKLLVCFLFYFIGFFLSSLFVRFSGLQFFSWLHHGLHCFSFLLSEFNYGLYCVKRTPN